MKFITTRCRMTCAKMKSANPRSGDIPVNCNLFSGFTCKRRQTATICMKKNKIYQLNNPNGTERWITYRPERSNWWSKWNRTKMNWTERFQRDSSTRTVWHRWVRCKADKRRPISIFSVCYSHTRRRIWRQLFSNSTFLVRDCSGNKAEIIRNNACTTIGERKKHNTFKWNRWSLTLDKMEMDTSNIFSVAEQWPSHAIRSIDGADRRQTLLWRLEVMNFDQTYWNVIWEEAGIALTTIALSYAYGGIILILTIRLIIHAFSLKKKLSNVSILWCIYSRKSK